MSPSPSPTIILFGGLQLPEPALVWTMAGNPWLRLQGQARVVQELWGTGGWRLVEWVEGDESGW